MKTSRQIAFIEGFVDYTKNRLKPDCRYVTDPLIEAYWLGWEAAKEMAR